MKVRIDWLRNRPDGQPFPPPTPETAAAYLSRIGGSSNAPETEEGWSIWIENVTVDSTGSWYADVHFVSQFAPVERLKESGSFLLYEGLEPIAEGRVL